MDIENGPADVFEKLSETEDKCFTDKRSIIDITTYIFIFRLIQWCVCVCVCEVLGRQCRMVFSFLQFEK